MILSIKSNCRGGREAWGMLETTKIPQATAIAGSAKNTLNFFI